MRNVDTFVDVFFVAFLIVIVFGTILGISSGQSFDARCAKVYERDSAKHELCVDRAAKGGPIHEENIGKM